MQGFTWPIEGLAILAPIIFCVLIVAFPLIGLAAGWKRAAFWGGGNIIFYFIGLLIWQFAGSNIIAPFSGMLTDLIKQLAQTSEITISGDLLVSVATPIWFMFWMAITELFLLINYYAWYKRVVGLNKIKIVNKKTGKITKQYAKINKKAGTVGYKVGNRLGGVLLLGTLTIPSTIAFTQTVYYLTTTSSTRSTNSFSNNLYNGLDYVTSGAFSWTSYYDKTGENYDSIFSAVTLINKKVIDPTTGEQTTVMEAVEHVISEGMTGIVDAIGAATDGGEGHPEPGTQAANQLIADSISDVAEYWNELADQVGTEIQSIFSADDVVKAVDEVMEPIIIALQQQMGSTEGKFEITEETYTQLFEGEVQTQFISMVETYIEKGTIGEGDNEAKVETTFNAIEVPSSTIDTITGMFTKLMDTSGIDHDAHPNAEENIEKSLNTILNLFFVPPQQV